MTYSSPQLRIVETSTASVRGNGSKASSTCNDAGSGFASSQGAYEVDE